MQFFSPVKILYKRTWKEEISKKNLHIFPIAPCTNMFLSNKQPVQAVINAGLSTDGTKTLHQIKFGRDNLTAIVYNHYRNKLTITSLCRDSISHNVCPTDISQRH